MERDANTGGHKRLGRVTPWEGKEASAASRDALGDDGVKIMKIPTKVKTA